MDHFHYKKNNLHAEEVAVAEIAAAIGTPFYCYSTATLERHFKVFSESLEPLDKLVCYAVKANSNIAVIKTLGHLGAGADVVSEGEIRRALAAGISPGKIVFSGIGKTRDEMAYALKTGIYQFNVESEPELVALDEVAKSFGKSAPVAIRVNPDVDGKTHKKITTGRKEDKFGIAFSQSYAIYARAKKLKNIAIKGISTHIGSQITDIKPFAQAFAKIRGLVKELRAQGHNIERIDLGGGLGIPYYGSENPPSPREYAAAVKKEMAGMEARFIFEPGRMIVGNSGILVSKLLYVKDTGHRVFYILDAGMNDLIRPSFYDAYHEIIPVRKTAAKKRAVDIVGPVCETGDIFAKQREMPAMKPGDLAAFRTAGAYGATMSSTYNSRLLIAEVLVKGGEFEVIRKRQSYEEMLAAETIPSWLKKGKKNVR